MSMAMSYSVRGIWVLFWGRWKLAVLLETKWCT